MSRGWRAVVAAAVFVMPAVPAAADVAFEFPNYRSAAQVRASCRGLLGVLKQDVARIVEMPADGSAAPLAALDALHRRSEDLLGPLALIAAVHPSKPLRDAADACERQTRDFESALLQNPRVHALLRQAQGVDAIDERFRRDRLDAFEDAGVALAPAQQARARAIDTEITRLRQDFERRIQEDRTRVAFSTTELAGVPPEVWRSAKRDARHRVWLRLDPPSSGPVIEQALGAASRERMWRAVMRVGGEANLRTLARLAALRREYAQLFGFVSYADFALRQRMAQSVAEVQAFLAEVERVVAPRERADLETLRQAKAEHLGLGRAATTLAHWDLAFYTERVRHAAYDLEPQRFRRHFPPAASLQFAFRLAERLFGVRFEAAPQRLWQRGARRFIVRDAGSSDLLGTLFVDLYPRADKYPHAAVWTPRSGSTLAKRLPAAALVVNLDRQGLSLVELETLLHEFGHALHALLSTTRYASQAGTEVQLDFVEAPSQMLEDWAYDPQVLRLFQEVCARCEPVPDALIAKARAARGFGRGIEYATQHLYAAYDLALHGAQPEDPMALWARLEGRTPLGFAPGSMLPAGFGHVAGDYPAAYYGYLWSEAVAHDLRTAFDGHRLDAEVGRRYRATLLANGGQVAPEALLRDFLGRPGDSRAFFHFLGTP